jgi:hypothetical protein
MKAISQEKGKQLKVQLARDRDAWKVRRQGTRASRVGVGVRLPPGRVFSVELHGCGHRARVEVLASGWLPRRAKCPKCRRWRFTRAGTARRPVQNATRRVVEERVEVRDGREFRVQVLATPPRARVR